MANLQSIPSSTLAFTIIPFLNSNDYLRLRITSKTWHRFFHESDESERLWKNALQDDFSFPITTTNESAPPSSSVLEREEGGTSTPPYLRTLRTSQEVLDRYRKTSSKCTSNDVRNDETTQKDKDDENGKSNKTKSVFGCSASESVYVAATAFESWKQWRMVNKIFYESSNESSTRGLKNHINGPYFIRAANLWSKIEQWCLSPCSSTLRTSLLDSFLPGVCSYKGRFHNLTHRHPQRRRSLHALEAIYAICNGQNTTQIPIHGLFGGYAAYDYLTVSYLLSAHSAGLMYSADGNGRGKHYPLAANIFQHYKCIEVVIDTGAIVVCGGNGTERSPALYHLKNDDDGTIRVDGGNGGANAYDEALVWMEEFAHRLYREEIATNEIHNEKMITLYPTIKTRERQVVGGYPDPVPVTSRAVTRGVEVVASGVFAHDLGCHVYSIRVQLLAPEVLDENSDGSDALTTCQLMSRNWKICSHVTGEVDEVTGDGVVGMYPLLYAGGGYRNDYGNSVTHVRVGEEKRPTKIFQYQSCSGPIQGSFRGKMKFVPGSLRDPKGDPFWVELAPFALDMTPRAVF